MVRLYNSCKLSSEIIKEHEFTASTFNKWVNRHNQTRLFKTSDNLKKN